MLRAREARLSLLQAITLLANNCRIPGKELDPSMPIMSPQTPFSLYHHTRRLVGHDYPGTAGSATELLGCPHLMVKVTGSGEPYTLNLNSSLNWPRMVELKEMWMTWSSSGMRMPSRGRKVKQEPRAVVGGIKLKRASMAPLLNRTACSRERNVSV